MARTGRPKWYPTPEQILKIQQMSGTGCTKEMIARALHINPKTVTARMKDFAPFSEAFTRGKDTATIAMQNVVYRMGLNDEHRSQFNAAKFWLERVARGPWQQTTVISTEPGAPVEIRGRVKMTDIDKALGILKKARGRKKSR